MEIPVEDVYDLRRRVLRARRPDADVRFPEDRVPGCFHLGVTGPPGAGLVAVASFSPAPTSLRPGAAAFRLRGMAVDAEHQGQGLGRALLEAASSRLAARGAAVLWAHLRDSAVDFYRQLGWEVVGEGFVEHGLPHHLGIYELASRESGGR